MESAFAPAGLAVAFLGADGDAESRGSFVDNRADTLFEVTVSSYAGGTQVGYGDTPDFVCFAPERALHSLDPLFLVEGLEELA